MRKKWLGCVLDNCLGRLLSTLHDDGHERCATSFTLCMDTYAISPSVFCQLLHHPACMHVMRCEHATMQRAPNPKPCNTLSKVCNVVLEPAE